MEFTITEKEQKLLLSQAREIITAELEKRKPALVQIDEDSTLNMPCGAFVTLHTGDGKNRKLRGCIGKMAASLPLIETIRIMAKEAAFGDPRFPPLKTDELSQCRIEISALSPMSPCPDPMQVKVGVHGLYLICDGRSGVLLPQVPVEQGWSLDEYLKYICIKAGVPAGSCFAPNAQVFTFTAIIFSED
jgi:AmmeMemoRadiSam system protein A